MGEAVPPGRLRSVHNAPSNPHGEQENDGHRRNFDRGGCARQGREAARDSHREHEQHVFKCEQRRGQRRADERAQRRGSAQKQRQRLEGRECGRLTAGEASDTVPKASARSAGRLRTAAAAVAANGALRKTLARAAGVGQQRLCCARELPTERAAELGHRQRGEQAEAESPASTAPAG
jgi:hypothetical protein